MTAAFLLIIVLSLVLAGLSKCGHAHQKAEDFFVASGQFSTILFFFLAVGETYSVATILGYPGGVYASGTGFVTWFLGYILLAFVVGYFLNPQIWRAGRIYGAVTLPDLFRRHYQSRALELTVTCASLLFLVPLGMMQFLGLQIVLEQLGWPLARLVLSALAGLLAFTYIAISGIRASAYVAVLKDILLIIAILLVGLAAYMHGGAAAPALAHTPKMPVPSLTGDLFSITTILLQSVAFCIVPQTCAYIFTARSASTVRRAQVTMPLYMLMFPFLTLVAYFALSQPLGLHSPNEVFLASARLLLPEPLVGVVMAGAALSALVVLTGICLTIGPLVSRNLVPGLNNAAQRRISEVVMGLYLILSIAGAAVSSQLLVTINNLFYFGIAQTLPGMAGILFLRRLRPGAIIAGLIAGDAIAIGIYQTGIPVGGINPGFIGLVANFAIAGAVSWLAPAQPRVPVAAMPLRRPVADNAPSKFGAAS